MDVEPWEHVTFGKHDEIGLEVENKSQTRGQNDKQHGQIAVPENRPQSRVINAANRLEDIKTTFGAPGSGRLGRQFHHMGGQHKKNFK